MAEVAKGIIDIEINTGSAASQLKTLQTQINAFNLALNKSSKNQGAFAAEYAKELQIAVNRTGAFTAETVRLATAAATLDKTLSKGKVSLGQFFSAKFNRNSAIAAETMALAAERARSMQTQFIATAGAANGMQEALAIKPLAAFSSQAAIAAQRTEVLSSMFRQGTTQLINFGKNVQWAGRQLMVGFTVPLTIFGSTASKTFMELEKQLVGFKKVYGDIFTTPAELNKNLESVKALASEYTKYGIAVKDTIGLAAQAAAAGRQNADLTDAVAQATRLATLGQMDQNAALETTISLQSAFRLSGQDLADTINFLNMVENQTVVSLQDISAAIPRVAPVIQGLGGDVKDLTVFLAAMQEGGVDAAEGANALKSGLASLINPTKQAQEMLKGFGINLNGIIKANQGDLMGTVMAFSQALQNLDQFSRQRALEQVFGKFQYAKLGALFDNISRQGSQAQQVIATMGYSTEQLGATADRELKTIEESFGVQLTGAIERFKLAIAPIGEIFTKTAIPIVNFLTDIINKFNGLSEGKKQFIAIATAIVGILIPAGTMLFGLLMNLTGTLLKMGQGLTAFTKGLITGGPLGAIKALSQSSKYLSLAEIDAAMAAQQLSVASEAVNMALLEQVGAAGAAQGAINSLVESYAALITTQNAAARMSGFAVPGAAANAAKNIRTGGAGFRIRRAFGGIIPGTGNQDTIPAMMTPGEFVVNKNATQQNYSLLKAINDGSIQGFNGGGLIALRRIGLAALNRRNEATQAASIIKSGRIAASSGRVSVQKTHFTEPQPITNISQLNDLISQGIINDSNIKVKIAKELVKNGVPVSGLTDDWANFLTSINQAGRRNTNTPMSVSTAIAEISKNKDVISFGKNSAFTRVYPNVNSDDFANSLINELGKLSANTKITDEILTTARNNAFPKMQNASKVSGVRLPTKGEIAELVGASGPRDPNFIPLANNYFRQNNIPIEVGKPKNIYLLDASGNRTGVSNIFAGSTGFSSGGNVPGSGNKDTVPAMLTPGEFVVNKKATQKNKGLLNAINNGGVKKYALGGVVGMAGMAAAMGGQFIPNQGLGNAVSTIGSAAMMAPMIFGKDGSGVISKAASSLANAMKVPVPGLLGIGAGVALTGLAIYKLNKQINNAANAGGEFASAMYGTARSSEEMAKFFGKQTFAQAARIAAVQRSSGKEISQQAQQQSLDFVSSEVGQRLVKDIGIVKAGGGNAVEALRNQLSSAIISGAIGIDEANAIAAEVGAAIGDQRIAVQVSGELNKLLGPDGKDVLKNLSTITAEISPKIDTARITQDATRAYEKLNLAQKGLQIFKGGEAGFAADYKISEVSAASAAAFRNEANALELLNLAYQEGKVSLEEYNKQRSSITTAGAKSQDNIAKTLGFQNYNDLVTSAKGKQVSITDYLGNTTQTTVSNLTAQKVISQQKDAFKTMLEDAGAIPEVVDRIMSDADKLGGTIFGKLLSGEISTGDIPILIRLQDDGLDEKGIEKVSTELAALSKIPNLDMVINLDTASAEQIDLLYKNWSEFEKSPDIYKKAFVESKEFSDSLNKLGIQYKQFDALPDIKKFVVITEVQALVNIRADMSAGRIDDAGARQDYAKTVSEYQKNIKDIFGALNTGIGGTGADAGTGGGAVKKWLDSLQNRFDLTDKRLSLEAQKYQDVIDLQQRQNELDQRNIDINNRALDQLAKQEQAVNDAYDARISALDGVSKANDRIKQQEQSRVDLATALASGNIAAAASTAADITNANAAYQIEDARAALELNREESLKNLKVEVNGQLFTRQQIEEQIDAIEEKIYQRNVVIQGQQDAIYAIEQQRLANSREREKVETRIYLLEQQKAITELKRMKVGSKTGQLSAPQAQALTDFKSSYNQMVNLFNSTYGENLPQMAMYGGKIKKFAYGGLIYKGSNESPPPLKMAFGSMVPGMGNTDRVPALLTPGEFVIRKSVAQANMPMLEALNNGSLSPKYTVPKTDFGVQQDSISQNTGIVYNDTYSINVNVSGTNASPDDIANAVISRLSQTNRGNVRGIRY